MNFYQLYKLNLSLINIAGYIRYVQYFLFNRKYFTIIRKNSVLKNPENASKVCYVCALGPSLKEVDLKRINGDTIVVNRFYKQGKGTPSFIPTYYLMVDSRFADDDHKKDFEECLNAYIDKGTKYILNSKCSNNDIKGLNSDNVFFISTFKGDFNSKKKLDISKVMPALGNVASAAIACAISMGYKKIVLLGCDFNSFASPINIHCYDDANKERLYRMYYELYRYSLAAYTHEEIAKYAKKQGVEIINSTKGTLIDAYPVIIDESLYKDEKDSK